MKYWYVTLYIDTASLNVIDNLFHSSTIKMLECQKQEGGKEGGLFATAYATAIGHGVNPPGI